MLKVLELKIRYFKNQKIANNSRCDYEVYGLSTNLNSPSPTKYDSLKVNSRKGFFLFRAIIKELTLNPSFLNIFEIYKFIIVTYYQWHRLTTNT